MLLTVRSVSYVTISVTWKKLAARSPEIAGGLNVSLLRNFIRNRKSSEPFQYVEEEVERDTSMKQILSQLLVGRHLIRTRNAFFCDVSLTLNQTTLSDTMIGNCSAYQASCVVNVLLIFLLSFFFVKWSGCFNVSTFEASWHVDPSRRIVNITLRTTRTGNWLGFGISDDRGMVSGERHLRKKLNGVAKYYCHLFHQCWVLTIKMNFQISASTLISYLS